MKTFLIYSGVVFWYLVIVFAIGSFMAWIEREDEIKYTFTYDVPEKGGYMACGGKKKKKQKK